MAPDRPTAAAPRAARTRRTLLVLAVALTLVALIQARHRALQGRSALLKWSGDVEAVLDADRAAGEVYFRDAATLDEGFPMLPLGALLLAPFLGIGGATGAWLWAAVKLGLAWWMLSASLRLAAADSSATWPPWAAALVVLLSLRVLLSDVSHGNVNIVVGATVVAAAVAWARGSDLQAGLWAGLGTVLKVTPGLLLVYLIRQRSPRGVAGWVLGVLLFALVLPGAYLGFDRTLELNAAWWNQMIAPFVTGAPVTLVQTEQINQSFLGVLARWTTDSVAIDGDPPTSIHVLDLAPGTFRVLLLVVSVATVGLLLHWTRPVGEGGGARARSGHRVLGDFALLALAMLMLSERSWKHHWVLLMLPLAYLAWVAAGSVAPRGQRRVALGALAASGALHGLTGSGILGDAGSDLAEAWGAFLAGGLVLFAAVGWLQERARPGGRPGVERR